MCQQHTFTVIVVLAHVPSSCDPTTALTDLLREEGELQVQDVPHGLWFCIIQATKLCQRAGVSLFHTAGKQAVGQAVTMRHEPAAAAAEQLPPVGRAWCRAHPPPLDQPG